LVALGLAFIQTDHCTWIAPNMKEPHRVFGFKLIILHDLRKFAVRVRLKKLRPFYQKLPSEVNALPVAEIVVLESKPLKE
jgi:hypothetical protein